MDQKGQCDLGMIGLGTMGSNFLLNISEHGFRAAGYDRDPEKGAQLRAENSDSVMVADDLPGFLALLKRPRAIMLLVPAGEPVDAVISELLPLLDKDDLIIDAGNSHYTDTAQRQVRLRQLGIGFLGMGISGGEAGARRGPSIMPGGNRDYYERIRQMMEAAAAKVDGEPCVAWLGEGAAGHYVKMVHNGIEYGLMQLIAETYDLMKNGCSLSNSEMAEIFKRWTSGPNASYLLEITAAIFAYEDTKTSKTLLDEIVGIAQQNGTGEWTSQSAFTLQIPAPTIHAAVGMRDMSVLIKQRTALEKLTAGSSGATAEIPKHFDSDFVDSLERGLHAAMLITYAQGFALLQAASAEYQYELDLRTVAKIWRGGCIIRSQMLEGIMEAFESDGSLLNLLLDPKFAKAVSAASRSLRHVVSQGALAGIALPALMASLSYFDAYRSVFSPANLIQAQRDYFGSHRYALIGKEGTYHTEWIASNKS